MHLQFKFETFEKFNETKKKLTKYIKKSKIPQI
jgi:hypothetical protein